MKMCKCDNPSWEVYEKVFLNCKVCRELYFIEDVLIDHHHLNETQPMKLRDDGIADYQNLKRKLKGFNSTFNYVVTQDDITYSINDGTIYDVMLKDNYDDEGIPLLIAQMYRSVLKLKAQHLILKHRIDKRGNYKNKANRTLQQMFKVLRDAAYKTGKNKGFWDTQLLNDLDDTLIDMVNITEASNEIEASRKGVSVENLNTYDVDQFINNWSVKQKVISLKLALIITEVVEAFDTLSNVNEMSLSIPEHTALADELADVIIRVLDLCGHLKLDLGKAVIDKMRYNETRIRKHGNKF